MHRLRHLALHMIGLVSVLALAGCTDATAVDPSGGGGGAGENGGTGGMGGSPGSGGLSGVGGSPGSGASGGVGGSPGTGASGGVGGSSGLGASGGVGGSPGTGASGGVGGSPGTAGSGGTGAACIGAADADVYANLDYVDSRGNDVTGPDAARAIASDCLFGAPSSVPPIEPGCGLPAGAVIACAVSGGCDAETVDALTLCVAECTDGAIEAIAGSGLSAECLACYARSVSCVSELCAAAGCTNPISQSCLRCRCEEDCIPGFDRCSGLPPSGVCDPFL